MTTKTTAKTDRRPKPAKSLSRTKKSEIKVKAAAKESITARMPEVATKTELAILLDMAVRNVTDHAAKGSFVPGAKNGTFMLVPSIQSYINKMREAAAGRAKELHNPVNDERLRGAQVEREINEIKLRNLKGEMLSSDEVSENWSAFGRSVKAKVMSIPTKARARLPHLTVHDQEALREIITDILNDLADEVEGGVIGGEAGDVRA